MKQYLDLLRYVESNGVKKDDELEQELKVYLVIKCVLIFQKDFL